MIAFALASSLALPDPLITEKLRFLSENPHSPRRWEVWSALGLLYAKSQDPTERERARNAFERAADSGKTGDRLRLGDYYFLQGEYANAAAEYQEVEGPEVKNRLAWCLLREGRLEEAAPLFGRDLSFLEREEKSEALARGLSLLVPGFGQIYSGKWESGLTSFLLNAGLFALLAHTLRERDYVGFSLAFGFGGRFYVGNLENATRFTREWNQRAKEEALRALPRFQPSL